MKKIIWIFGQSATGKETLINKLVNNDLNACNSLELNNLKICACNNTLNDEIILKCDDIFSYNDSFMQEDNEYFNREKAKNRRSCIMMDTYNFINSSYDVLLLKGQDNDIWPGRGDIVKYFLDNFSNNEQLEIEILMLTVQDEDIWKKRIESKEWFKNFEDKIGVMENMLNDRKSMNHENRVYNAFSGYEVPIVFVDSGENCYTILKECNVKKRK